ncbi:hypothetical protein GCM10027299_51940 [Larkinella ripae]
MSLYEDNNLPNHATIETRWLKLVNEIQQKHNVLIDLIEKFEQNPVMNQVNVFYLTRLQQHVLDTLNNLIAESLTDSESVSPVQFSEELHKKDAHSEVLIQLRQQIDLELDKLSL